MFRIKALIIICILGAIFVDIESTNNPVFQNLSNASALEAQLNVSLRQLDEDFQLAAKCLKNRMQNGVPRLNIPRLDPINLPFSLIIINNDLVKARMIFSNTKLQGLSEFNLTDGAFNGLIPDKMHMRVHVDAITFNTGYHGSMTLFNMLKIFGNGNARISVKNFELDMKIYLKVNLFPPWSPKIKLTGLDLTIQLPSTDVKITGLFNDDQISLKISETLTHTINKFLEENTNIINKFVKETLWWFLDNKVNKILKNINALKLHGMMKENVDLLCKGLNDFPEKYFQKFQAGIQDYLNVQLQDHF